MIHQRAAIIIYILLYINTNIILSYTSSFLLVFGMTNERRTRTVTFYLILVYVLVHRTSDAGGNLIGFVHTADKVRMQGRIQVWGGDCPPPTPSQVIKCLTFGTLCNAKKSPFFPLYSISPIFSSIFYLL